MYQVFGCALQDCSFSAKAPTSKSMAAASTKKRPAASQGGPKPKKVHVDKAAKSSDKKRSRPVTLPTRDVSDATDSDEDLEDVEDVDEEIGQDEYPMEVDETPANKTPKDPAGSSSVSQAFKS